MGLTFGVQLLLYSIGLYRFGFQTKIVFTNAAVVRTVLYEICIGLVLAWFLALRGWRRTDFRINVTAITSAIGLLLWLGVWFLFILAFSLLSGPLGLGHALQGISILGRLSIPMVLLVCLVNPLFEELLTLGYVVKAMESHGALFAIGVSTLLRLSVHLYQGPLGVASILPMGVVFAAYYWKTRQLWPPIVAHFLFDLLALLHHT